MKANLEKLRDLVSQESLTESVLLNQPPVEAKKRKFDPEQKKEAQV